MWPLLNRYIAAHGKNVVSKKSFVVNWFSCWYNQYNPIQTTNNYSTEVSITLEDAFKRHNLEHGPESTVIINREQAANYYYQMQTIRRLESAASTLYMAKVIRGFCHLYTGQEAIAVGIKAALRSQDSIITSYRCHAWCFIMGITLEGILAELCGFSSGCQRGKGGSMHMFCKNFYGGQAIVGAQIPLGTGVALASKYKGEGGVCVACYGDGAASQGQIFESNNMAALWNLPVIFLCENNIYGMGTKSTRSSCNTDFYKHGKCVPGIWVDGMNVLAVRSATQFAIDYALKSGPIVIEVYTYRYTGHSMSDPGSSYRTRGEVQEVRKSRDPIMNFKNLCVSKGLLTEDEINTLDDKIKKEITAAMSVASSGKEIPLTELAGDVYAKNLEPAIRAVRGFSMSHVSINKGVNH